jgi:hypothetical protein
MRYSQSCDCCGQKVTAYTHKLNKAMVWWFAQLIGHFMFKHEPANLQRDLDLTINQNNNFQKLQYFWLVERTKWWWVPTQYWILFYEWKVPVYERVATLGKITLWLDHMAWQSEKKLPKTVMVWEVNETYKSREEYQQEKGFSWLPLFTEWLNSK